MFALASFDTTELLVPRQSLGAPSSRDMAFCSLSFYFTRDLQLCRLSFTFCRFYENSSFLRLMPPISYVGSFSLFACISKLILESGDLWVIDILDICIWIVRAILWRDYMAFFAHECSA